MRKRVLLGSLAAGILLLGVIGSSTNTQKSDLDNARSENTPSLTKSPPEKIKPTCDGTTVIAECDLDNVSYKTYVYHPAVEEKTHTETITTYREEITGYCTLCNDGTYSPSCATGRGACSHHGGVDQWNAPRYSTVPVYTTNTVVDVPYQEAYYEKVESNN